MWCSAIYTVVSFDNRICNSNRQLYCTHSAVKLVNCDDEERRNEMRINKTVANTTVFSVLIFWAQQAFAAVREIPILEDLFLSLALTATGGPGLAAALFAIMACGFTLMYGSNTAKSWAAKILVGILVVWGAAILFGWARGII